jgi:hypothetical protein
MQKRLSHSASLQAHPKQSDVGIIGPRHRAADAERLFDSVTYTYGRKLFRECANYIVFPVAAHSAS